MNCHIFTIFTFASLALAFLDPVKYQFRPATPFDSRSPCPGLNALANHGYLPRDGKNIDYKMVDEAARAAYGFVPGFYKDPVDMVFKFNISTTDRPSETFHLLDLARHDTIEVDGSLTRNDIFFGDDVHFDTTVWSPVAKDLGLDSFNYFDRFVTVDSAANATKNRLQLAKSANPQFNASQQQHFTEYGTTALYMLAMWDENNEAAPKSWVKALMAEDRIPYREGYSKGKKEKDGMQIGNLTVAIREAAGWQA